MVYRVNQKVLLPMVGPSPLSFRMAFAEQASAAANVNGERGWLYRLCRVACSRLRHPVWENVFPQRLPECASRWKTCSRSGLSWMWQRRLRSAVAGTPAVARPWQGLRQVGRPTGACFGNRTGSKLFLLHFRREWKEHPNQAVKADVAPCDCSNASGFEHQSAVGICWLNATRLNSSLGRMQQSASVATSVRTRIASHLSLYIALRFAPGFQRFEKEYGRCCLLSVGIVDCLCSAARFQSIIVG